MKIIRVDNYIIEEPIINILEKLRVTLTNGKLKDIRVGSTDITVTCPNDDHDGGAEKNPDCHINIDDSANSIGFGVFHCFACGVSGTFVHFVALCFSSSDEYAKHWLIKNYGKLAHNTILLDEPIRINKVKTTNYLDPKILDQYQPWCPYLAERKLDRDICNKFHVKYDNEHRQVVFPIYDEKDNLVMLARRSIDTKFFHMDKDVDKPLYGLNIILKNNVKTCMIVEGLIDMLTCWSNGIPAIATLGEVSDEQIAKINNSCIRSLYLAFDNDSAGRKFTQHVLNALTPGILTTTVQLPRNRKDVNDLTFEEWENLKKKYFD